MQGKILKYLIFRLFPFIIRFYFHWVCALFFVKGFENEFGGFSDDTCPQCGANTTKTFLG